MAKTSAASTLALTKARYRSYAAYKKRVERGISGDLTDLLFFGIAGAFWFGLGGGLIYQSYDLILPCAIVGALAVVVLRIVTWLIKYELDLRKDLNFERGLEADLEVFRNALPAADWLRAQLCPADEDAIAYLKFAARELSNLEPKENDIGNWLLVAKHVSDFNYSWVNRALILALRNAELPVEWTKTPAYNRARRAQQFLLLFKAFFQSAKVVALAQGGNLPKEVVYCWALAQAAPELSPSTSSPACSLDRTDESSDSDLTVRIKRT